MTHGKNHDERLQKVRRSRANNTPDPEDDDVRIEAGLVAEGGGGARPRAGLIGPHVEGWGSRGAMAAGAEVAPTPKAELRERIRHRIEREKGRVAAGTDDRLRDTRTGGVTPEDLAEAACEADRAVAGRELGHLRRDRDGGSTGEGLRAPGREE
jgi:hypothetical protein